MKNIVLAALFALASSAASAEPMWFKSVSNGGNCGDCAWAIAEGEITEGTPDALRAFLEERGRPAEFVFNSKGGNLGAALEIGRIIRESNSSTGIGRSVPLTGSPWYHIEEGGTCESACAFVFFAGTVRYANEGDSDSWQPRNGKLGMHQFYTPNGQNIPTEATQKLMGQVLNYIIDMGIDGGILSMAAQTPPDSMHFFTKDELVDLGVLTYSGKSPFALTIRDGGLAYGWQEHTATGKVTQDIHLRCSRALGGWELNVHHHDVTGSLGFDPDNPKDMGIAVAGQRYPMGKSSIRELELNTEDRSISVALPIDPQEYAGERFIFTISGLRNWAHVLSAAGPFPDAMTVQVMNRACGD
jgi:hypothetical protein